MRYIKQLDSIRALAVLSVIVEHWLPKESKINFFVNGSMGVEVFFVLSGFLITGILINNKIKSEESPGINKISIFKNFYVRRTLRIFPIYYLAIFFLLIFHEISETNIKPNFIYFLTYTTNFYFYKIQAWDGIVSHLWSLAVEEQFYIIWPFIILLIPKKYLLHIITLFIAIGLASQHYWAKTEFDNLLVMTCFDSFGMGALLSWIIIFKPQRLNQFYKIIFVLGLLSSGLLIVELVKPMHSWFSDRTLHSIIALWIISYIMEKEQKNQLRFTFIFNNKFLLFLGKISYGIYLYHFIIPMFTVKYLKSINSNITTMESKWSFYVLYAEYFCILLLVSWLSWRLIEKPVLSLKKYFNYLSGGKQYV
ncbi:MAG: acyltransferase [Chitinophagaceae bacterium]